MDTAAGQERDKDGDTHDEAFHGRTSTIVGLETREDRTERMSVVSTTIS
jgi:hypothetical protein